MINTQSFCLSSSWESELKKGMLFYTFTTKHFTSKLIIPCSKSFSNFTITRFFSALSNASYTDHEPQTDYATRKLVSLKTEMELPISDNSFKVAPQPKLGCCGTEMELPKVAPKLQFDSCGTEVQVPPFGDSFKVTPKPKLGSCEAEVELFEVAPKPKFDSCGTELEVPFSNNSFKAAPKPKLGCCGTEMELPKVAPIPKFDSCGTEL
ncbi:hypothetical protein RND71_034012 [Anisodus tanguticus]|uniref:Uncharacterized protein n=1 Tax=Anisodus tanguticus TaxID=243964 RepID=A0AAE1RAJ2_9SOLA|nr:hypothetical protein RND71_034012 [Anisodus tanguticus]